MNVVFLSHMYLDDETYMIGIIWFCDEKKLYKMYPFFKHIKGKGHPLKKSEIK